MNRKTKIKNKSKSKKSSAQKNSVAKVNTNVSSISVNKDTTVVNSKPSYLELPVSHIKSDLIGIILFAAFAFGLIFILKHYNITLDLVLSYISTTFMFL